MVGVGVVVGVPVVVGVGVATGVMVALAVSVLVGVFVVVPVEVGVSVAVRVGVSVIVGVHVGVRAMTLVWAELLLLLRFESVWLPMTLAASLMVPLAVGVTVMVIVAVAPLAKLPSVQLSVPDDGGAQVPWLGVADTNVALDGRKSLTVTPVPFEGPLFVIVTV